MKECEPKVMPAMSIGRCDKCGSEQRLPRDSFLHCNRPPCGQADCSGNMQRIHDCSPIATQRAEIAKNQKILKDAIKAGNVIKLDRCKLCDSKKNVWVLSNMCDDLGKLIWLCIECRQQIYHGNQEVIEQLKAI